MSVWRWNLCNNARGGTVEAPTWLEAVALVEAGNDPGAVFEVYPCDPSERGYSPGSKPLWIPCRLCPLDADDRPRTHPAGWTHDEALSEFQVTRPDGWVTHKLPFEGFIRLEQMIGGEKAARLLSAALHRAIWTRHEDRIGERHA